MGSELMGTSIIETNFVNGNLMDAHLTDQQSISVVQMEHFLPMIDLI